MDTRECSGKSRASKSTNDSSPEEELECAVCLQPCIHPVRLPCSHIFCFLCVKGVANQSKRCAMCRQEIPADFLDNPNLLKKIEEKESNPEGYQWFYEGRNGWWQYDPRTNEELEEAYRQGSSIIVALIAGQNYVLDLQKMLQYQKNDPHRKRNMKRELRKSSECQLKGWWQYDERTSRDLEGAYNRGQRVFEVLVAGFLYSVDFDRMVQQRRNDPSRRRRIKRDLSSIPKKGVAGLKTEEFTDSQTHIEEEEALPESTSLPDPPIPPPNEAEVNSLPARAPAPESPDDATSQPSSSSSIPVPASEMRMSPELESLHLLHSDLHRNAYRNYRRSPVPVRSSDPISVATRGRNGSSYTRLQQQPNGMRSASMEVGICDLGDPSPEGQDLGPGERVVLTESVNSITNQIRNLILENEESEYYSLDGTEEYNLPNDNEDL